MLASTLRWLVEPQGCHGLALCGDLRFPLALAFLQTAGTPGKLSERLPGKPSLFCERVQSLVFRVSGRTRPWADDPGKKNRGGPSLFCYYSAEHQWDRSGRLGV